MRLRVDGHRSILQLFRGRFLQVGKHRQSKRNRMRHQHPFHNRCLPFAFAGERKA